MSNDYGNTPLDVATAPEIRATLKKAAGGRDARKEIGAEVEEVLWDIVNKTGDESRRASVELTAQSRPMAGRGVEDEQAAAEWEERLRQHEAAQKRRYIAV